MDVKQNYELATVSDKDFKNKNKNESLEFDKEKQIKFDFGSEDSRLTNKKLFKSFTDVCRSFWPLCIF